MRHVLLIMGILLLAGCETEYFASAPDSVIVVQFRSAEPIDVEIALDYPHPHRQDH